MLSPINQRIAVLIRILGVSQNAFAKKLGTSSSRISNFITDRNKPDSDILAGIIQNFEVDAKWLMTGEGEPFGDKTAEVRAEGLKLKAQHGLEAKNIADSERNFEDEAEIDYTSKMITEEGKVKGKVMGKVLPKVKYKSTQNLERQVQPILVTVDGAGRENIVLVQAKARAGYLSGYGDPEFIEHLPTFNIPGLQNDIYRAFEVDGYSMLAAEGAGLYPSDLVVGSYIENPSDMRDTRVYVVVSTEGVLIKRCINRLNTEAQKLILNSDNKNGEYPPIILDRHQIIEVWEARGKWSRQLPMPGHLFDTVIDLQARMILMESELKKLKD